MAKKLRVGVVFGGRSGEHEVSLAGAASVLAAIDRSRFDVIPIGIARNGRWLVGGDPLRALGQEAGAPALARTESSESLPSGLRDSLDVVVIMLHGPQGEDGTIQGLLELAGVPYTG